MSDPEAIVRDIQKAWADFQVENDQRLDARFQDVVTSEKVDRINGAISDLQAKLDEANRRVDEVEVSAQRPGPTAAAADAVKRDAEAFFAGVRNQSGYEATPDDVAAYREYDRAFGRFLRAGDRSSKVEAAMRVGGDPDGGYFVPTGALGRIVTKIRDTSPVRQVASVVSITTDSVEWMRDLDEAASGGWVGEAQPRSATGTPEVGMQRLYVHEQYAMPEVTQRLLDMATVDVESWLGDKVADKMGRVENTAFVSGNGSGKPRGFLDYASSAVTAGDTTRSDTALQFVASGADGGFDGTLQGNPLIDMVAALHPRYRTNARWAMNRMTEAEVRKLKDSEGRYLVDLEITEGVSGFRLVGYPVVNFEDMPDVDDDAFSIALADWSAAYLVLDGRGIRVLRDPYTRKGWVRFYTTKFTGGDVIDFSALKLLKFAA